MMKLFDTHAHYNDDSFNEDRDEIIKSFPNNNVVKCVNVGYNIESSIKAIEISKKYDYIYATCGIHPSDIPQTEEELWIMIEKIKELAIQNTEKVLAIGEIGLDYHWQSDNKELQQKAFIKQIELANELKLPISIHSRDAIDDTINIIKKRVKIENGGILHCCPFNKELVKNGLECGLYISFAGPTTFKNAKNANEIIMQVPLEKMLIETDSPYLAPEPVRGKRNDSRNVKYIAQKIADVRNMTLEEISEITYQNAIKVFNVSD